jgi:aspartate/methionine/tyrosine aminotransferase
VEVDDMARAPSARAAAISPSVIRKLFDARRPSSINLGLGEPHIPVPLELLDAGYARYRAQRPGYTLNAGLPALRERIAAHFRLPFAGAASQVVVTVGLQEALFATLLAVGDPGDDVVLLDPTFLAYRTVAELLGLNVVRAPLRRDRGFGLDPDAIAAAIGPRTCAVVLNSPSNPTGRIDREDELRAVVQATEKHGVWLISDEVYGECWASRPPTSVGTLTERAIVLGALSKSCAMTGFRLGWAIAPAALAGAIAATHQFNVTCAPTISQHLALEVFEHPEWLGTLRNQLAAGRRAMTRAIDAELGLPYLPPEGGFFVFLDVSSCGEPSLTLAERLLADGDVVTVPGSAFGANGEGWLRLSYAADAERIEEGVRRIRSVLRGGGRG